MNSDELEFENEATLNLVQAQLGLISKNIVAVALRAKKEEDSLELIFWVHEKTDELEDDIEEIIFDLDALYGGESPYIKITINSGYQTSDKVKPCGRMVYWAKK
ncbi:hypothetical protein [Nocardiopsis chromatogenes]|uniref:hypothetical protein n=1 Tax=Nocardiopsis chromatogenes TaxID=280239 RepID=UPI001267F0C9|nr:hypothetical protein [Nocardiopsis chromatogenes]